MVEQRQFGPLREPGRFVERTHSAQRFDSFLDTISSSTHQIVSWTRPTSAAKTDTGDSRPAIAPAWGPYVKIECPLHRSIVCSKSTHLVSGSE